MRWPRFRLTVFRLLLIVAISGILIHVAIDTFKDRARERYERCRQIAEWHASLASAYRSSAPDDEANHKRRRISLRISAWHRHMSGEFEQAGRDPFAAMPKSFPFPHASWEPSIEEDEALE